LKKVYGILTNLSPNILVPTAAFKISKKYKIPLKFYYVLDSTEPIDEEEETKAQKELLAVLKRKKEKYNIKFEFDVVFQEISSFLNQFFKKDVSALVILGRFKKPIKIPFIHLDKK